MRQTLQNIEFKKTVRPEEMHIGAYVGDQIVGYIKAVRDFGRMSVAFIEVDEGLRRQGVATRLYEEAARVSCGQYGLPLSSGTRREWQASAFWQKQVAKGRAERVVLRESWGTSDDYYTLTCPPPKSLRNNARRAEPVGDCFKWAYDYVMQHRDATLHHARVTHPWDRNTFWHAWAERDGRALDWQTVVVFRREPRTIKNFREVWQPQQEKVFGWDEAAARIVKYGHFGPWRRNEWPPRSRHTRASAERVVRVSVDAQVA